MMHTAKSGLRWLGMTLMLATLVLPAFGQPGRNPLVQRRVHELVDRAQVALEQGRLAEAQACADLVLIRRTVRVRVDYTNVPSNQLPAADRAVRDTLIMWQDTLDGEVTFQLVSSGTADVRIRYAPSVRTQGREIGAFATWSRNLWQWSEDSFDYRISADITLRTHKPNGEAMTYGAWRHTAGHELGHVLGLWDSGRVGDLMGPVDLDRPVLEPTAREREALLSTRGIAMQVQQTLQLVVRR